MLGEMIDKVIEPRGAEVGGAQIKDIEIPQSVQRAMAQEAEAHREKRALIIKAEAEYEAATQMVETPMAIELRRMQMLTGVGAEQNTMAIVMMPSEFVTAANAAARFMNKSASAEV
jgi:regulator of protease activity HflC (stomatin/prohibitin superfamily)